MFKFTESPTLPNLTQREKENSEKDLCLSRLFYDHQFSKCSLWQVVGVEINWQRAQEILLKVQKHSKTDL